MRLKHYINHEIRLAMTAVVSVLMLIFTSQQFVRFLSDTVDGKISAEILLFMVGLQIPPLLGFLLPLGLFLGILLAFGRMYVDHELIVAHSVGVGDRQLATMILPSIIAISVIAGVFSLWVAPWAAEQQQNELKQQDGKSELQFLTPGKFQVSRDGSSVMYVAASGQNGEMEQVFFAQLPQMELEHLGNTLSEKTSGADEKIRITASSQLKSSNTVQDVSAESGVKASSESKGFKTENFAQENIEQAYIGHENNAAQWRLITAQRGMQQSIPSSTKENSEPLLVLIDGASYSIPLHSKRWEVTSFDEYSMKINQNSSSARKLKVKSVPTLELFEEPTAEKWAEFHWRLSIPISIPILALLAVPLSRVQPRQGKFAKMLPALALYMAYIVLILGSRGLLEDQKVPSAVGMWWVHLLMIALLWFLYRQPKKNRQKSVGGAAA